MSTTKTTVGYFLIFFFCVTTSIEAQLPQYTFSEQIGTASPLDTIKKGLSVSSGIAAATIGDLDGDGDNDLIIKERVVSGGMPFPIISYRFLYYVNSGTSNSPVFTTATSANILPIASGIQSPTLVDIDADGDLDVFAGLSSAGGSVAYFENTGTVSSPTFVRRSNGDNPLDSVEYDLNNLIQRGNKTPIPRFVDIDDDGDQDCFLSISGSLNTWDASNFQYKILFYENLGNRTTPIYVRNTNNPLSSIVSRIDTTLQMGQLIDFIELDGDSDFDVVYSDFNGAILTETNVGSATNPVFALTTNPFATLNNPLVYVLAIGQLSSNGLVEAISGSALRYFDNSTVLQVPTLPTQSLAIYPNPIQAQLHWTKPLTGTVRIYNTLGLELHHKSLHEAQQVDLSTLAEGTYWITIKTATQLYAQSIVINRF